MLRSSAVKDVYQCSIILTSKRTNVWEDKTDCWTSRIFICIFFSCKTVTNLFTAVNKLHLITWWIILVPAVISHQSPSTTWMPLHLMNYCPSFFLQCSNEPRLPSPSAPSRPGTGQHNSVHQWRMLRRWRYGKYGKHWWLLDVKIKKMEGCSHTSLHIPPSLCWVILPYSAAALLTARTFSKGRGVRSAAFHVSA